MAKITLISDTDKDRSYEIYREVVMGRSPDNAIVLSDAKASRHHSRVWLELNSYFIEDLQSRNGTLVNGKAIQKQRLFSGDRIKIGQTVLVFTEDDDPGATEDISEISRELSPAQPVVLSNSARGQKSKAPRKKAKLPKTQAFKKTERNRRQAEDVSALSKDFSHYSLLQKIFWIIGMLCFMALVTWVSRWLTLAIIG